MSTKRSLPDLVARCASTEHAHEQLDLANDISEQLYAIDADLSVLTPLFESGNVGCWRTLSMILEEHSHRSDEVVPWLGELIGSSDEQVRYRSLRCVMELDPRAHPNLVWRMLDLLRDVGSVAIQVSITQFLAHVDLAALGPAISTTEGPLGEQLKRLERGEPFDLRAAVERGGVEALVAVASAAREQVPQARELLAAARDANDTAVQVAADTLLDQLDLPRPPRSRPE